jgi:polyhydroxybutyrate depolymerase
MASGVVAARWSIKRCTIGTRRTATTPVQANMLGAIRRSCLVLLLVGCGHAPPGEPLPPAAPDATVLPVVLPQLDAGIEAAALPPVGSDAGPDGQPRLDTAVAPAPADGPVTSRSAGCGKPATGTSRYERRTIVVGAVEREYFVWIPRGYDPTRAYPLIFRWHGTGGNGTSGGLEIEDAADEDGLVASPSAIGGVWSLEAGGPDVALFDALLTQMNDTLCVDRGRVFSYGFSRGAAFTNLLACVRSNVLRAVAPVDGLSGGDHCTGKIAAWITHGSADTTVPIAVGISVRDRYLALDGCTAATVPEAPAPCVRYQGCAAGQPVVWCETRSEHDPQAKFTAPGAWEFFRSLPPVGP